MAQPGKLDAHDAKSLAARVAILCIAFLGTIIGTEIVPALQDSDIVQPIVLVILAALGEVLVKVAKDTDSHKSQV